jgi:acetate CoA/acetoacetate CoA-transferase alpha subunit
VIVEIEHIVPTGMISPDHVMTPAALVDYVVVGTQTMAS